MMINALRTNYSPLPDNYEELKERILSMSPPSPFPKKYSTPQYLTNIIKKIEDAILIQTNEKIKTGLILARQIMQETRL
jgi:hypothetical protein